METVSEIEEALNWIIIMVMAISLNLTIALAGLIFITAKIRQQLKQARKTVEEDIEKSN